MFISQLADGFIFASSRSKEYYKNLLPKNKKYFLIQAPVDVSFFDPKINFPEKVLPNLNKKNKLIVGTVANINPSKGLFMILKTAKILSKYNKKIIFVIIGPVYDSQKLYYEKLLNFLKINNIKNVIFLGNKKDIRPILNYIDVYVCSSNFESSPQAVWEAMSMSKAVISTNVGDVSKFIIDNKNGFIIPTGDTISLSKKVEKFILEPDLINKFGKLLRSVAKNKLDLKMCTRQHINAYRKILF